MSYEEDDDWTFASETDTWTGTDTGRQVAEAFAPGLAYVHEGDHAEVTCYACPLQVEGVYHGHPFYFRARHGRWSLGVGAADADADAAVTASFQAFGPAAGGQTAEGWRVGSGIGPGFSWGQPEPDDQEDAGTFGTWLLLRLAEICK